jgi:hypothetical protein
MNTANTDAAPNDAVAMGAVGPSCHGWTGRDRVRPDNIDTAAARIFGIGLGPGGNRSPNRDKGCGGNDERLLHAASPGASWLLTGIPRIAANFLRILPPFGFPGKRNRLYGIPKGV